MTEDQACPALIDFEALAEQGKPVSGAITTGTCDHAALYDANKFQQLVNDPTIDVIVRGVRGYPNVASYPQMFGWIDAENGLIRTIWVKMPLSNSASDTVVLGTFTFRRAEDFHRAVARLISRDGCINGEFYIDTLIYEAIALGMRCALFDVDSCLCSGAPNDLRTFEYWQSCFEKWNGHPYRLEQDNRIPADKVSGLSLKYKKMQPELPKAPALSKKS
ncbi:hypothetical protein LU631_18030 [Erwinia tracheiphila]|uniref:hypothetical protein n=1 Tax=Erwinia tracheiphila TaxID=65700 RepID=UPI001F3821DA|nr:hypothetical protein [Erwinia tracheiphila]UIA86758.1 hypothetical protein LU631_18030 [Erwinia tracheiphila]UIA95114.1 hypothetical protein LU633_16490 [Erwinia tracheiphila]